MIDLAQYVANNDLSVTEFANTGDTVRLHGQQNGDLIIAVAPVENWRTWYESMTPVGYYQANWYCGVATAWKILNGDDCVTWPGVHALHVFLIKTKGTKHK